MKPSKLKARIMTFALSTLLVGCSVVDPKKVDGLAKLEAWHKSSTSLAKRKSGDEKKYATAQKNVNDWIDSEKEKVNDIAGQLSFEKVDLSATSIPPNVTKSVNAYENSVTRAGGTSTANSGIDWIKIGIAVANWAVDETKTLRKESGDNLSKRLDAAKWSDWGK